MDRFSKFARPLGIAMAVIGVSMVAISGYYLYAYMRSGSDAEDFNVAAAAPEEMLALLGQGLPEPVSPAPHRSSVSNGLLGDGVDAEAAASKAVLTETQFEVENRPNVETVSISSVLPDVALVVGNNGKSDGVAKRVVDAGVHVAGEEPLAARARESAAESSIGDESSSASSVSTEVMLDTFTSIYPGGSMNPRYWSEPHWAGNLPFGGPTIPEGFEPVDAADVVQAASSGERALRMRIPSIDLDASVSELELRDLGDSRAWSTPDKVVGHIPTTARPGELANGWYFGHLDDFLSNEGAIFRRLPEISGMIRNEPVDIFLATDEAEYLYRVTGTQQVHRDELFLAESDDAQISLVTCWPFRVYDHRIVVSAVLIAVKSLNEA